jgi:Uma2 family endonuclease
VRIGPFDAKDGADSIGSEMAAGGALTYEDLASFPDDGLRRELLDGELIVTPAPRLRHQDVVLRLGMAFGNHLSAHGGGRVFIAPADVVLSDRDVLEPDVLFIADSQVSILTEANVRGAPSLVIEVLSDPRVDRVRKRDAYARFGVPEYWIADPDADRVEVYGLAGGRYAKPEIFEPGDRLTYAGLPGLTIDVAELFAR